MPVCVTVPDQLADGQVNKGCTGHTGREGANGGREGNSFFGELDGSHGGERMCSTLDVTMRKPVAEFEAGAGEVIPDPPRRGGA